MGDVIWFNTLDGGLFEVSVTATGERTAEHVITKDGVIIYKQEVGLAYGAIFGPDAADVAEWQEVTVREVDKWYRDHGQTPPT